ncbi:MAG: hypothetical protein OEW23_17585 [Candidatus Aminicenantes bacterium]|nr:hypothetical protein [Candidatus Aminicenantes bacterium]
MKRGSELIKKDHKTIADRINECRHQPTKHQSLSSLKELLDETNDGLVSYELAHMFEKIGKDKEAVRYYEKAESLFKEDSYKNMARSAINNIVIEALIAEKKKKKK